MAAYDKAHQRRRQAAFLPGPIDQDTGNYAKSEAEKAGVKQWPQSKTERRKYEQFMRRTD